MITLCFNANYTNHTHYADYENYANYATTIGRVTGQVMPRPVERVNDWARYVQPDTVMTISKYIVFSSFQRSSVSRFLSLRKWVKYAFLMFFLTFCF